MRWLPFAFVIERIRCPASVVLLSLWVIILSPLPSLAQQTDTTKVDTTHTIKVDTSRHVLPKNMREREVQGPKNLPSGNQQQPGKKEGTVNFSAKDSLIFLFKPDRDATLYGSAKVQHTQGTLSAGKITLNLDTHIMKASAANPQDTLSHPVLTRGGGGGGGGEEGGRSIPNGGGGGGGEKIRSEKIAFNYKTGKGKFTVARVNVHNGNLIGTQVKNKTPKVIFIKNAIYSTCMLPHPHFYIKAKKMKVVNQKEIFFTNARLYILDIPYPIILPFGYVPAKIDRKQSGFLAPTYAFQQQQTRGLGLRNLGWFQYFNDHLTGKIDFDIYTSGTFHTQATLNYAKTDKYTGSIDVGYSLERGLEPTDPNFQKNIQKKISIQHNEQLSPYANLNANINFRTSNYYTRNSYNINNRASVSTDSRIAYQFNQPNNLYNFNISMAQSQNFQTNTTTLTGPTMSFSLKTLSPFQSNNPLSNKWYQSISISYRNNFDSRFDYTPIAADSAQTNWFEALTHPAKYREATGKKQLFNFGFRQNGSISAQFLPRSHFNLSGSINMSEYWYPETIRKMFNPDSNRVETHYVKGFVAAHQFSSSLSLNTRLYGIWNQRIGNLYGFRHTLIPTISFSYSPDFSKPFWGIYRTVQTDTLGNTQRYPIYQGSIINGPGSGRSESISLGLNNIFETKQIKRDSTGEKKEKVIKLIDNLSANTSYNFAARRFKLSPLNTSLNTSIINNVNINASANFSFYATDSLGTLINKYLLTETGHLLRLTSFNISAGTSFRGGQNGGHFSQPRHYYYPAHYDPYNQRFFHTFDPMFNTTPVEPFDVPWSFSLSFNYSWNYINKNRSSKSAVINAQSITMNPTPEWQLSTSLGYDFVQHKLTPSQFRVSRRLHMWNLNFTFNPFGNFKYYLFSLTVNNAQFQSIIQKLPFLNNLEQSNSPISRGAGSSGFGGGF